VKDLCKTLERENVLDHISLKVEKGDVIAVLGPSGGGKTTLLRCLNFLERADSGTLIFDQKAYDLSSIGNRDFPVVQAIVVLLAAWIVIVNYAADFLNRWLDPRMRAQPE
jgi:ABC-type polar amino acid transport system ATPase subunit